MSELYTWDDTIRGASNDYEHDLDSAIDDAKSSFNYGESGTIYIYKVLDGNRELVKQFDYSV